MSGFLTAYSDSRKRECNSFLRDKYIRILPAAWLSMSFYLFIAIAYRIIIGTDLVGVKLDTIHILSSFLMVNQGWVIDLFPAVNNPTWYLDVLMLCYILYYCIRKFVKSNITRSFICIGIIFFTILGNILNMQFPFFWLESKRGYVAFFSGILIYELYVTFRKKLKYFLVILVPLSIAGILYRGLSDWYLLVSFVFPAVIIIAISLPQVHHKFINIVGAISFEVYLWHGPLLKLVLLICDAVGYRIEHSYLSMIVFSLLVWGVATLIYHFFERPVGIWLKNMMDQLFKMNSYC